jgi:hypothetical protein
MSEAAHPGGRVVRCGALRPRRPPSRFPIALQARGENFVDFRWVTAVWKAYRFEVRTILTVGPSAQERKAPVASS